MDVIEFTDPALYEVRRLGGFHATLEDAVPAAPPASGEENEGPKLREVGKKFRLDTGAALKSLRMHRLRRHNFGKLIAL